MMPDMEKVIEEFEHLLNVAKGNYQDFVDLTVDEGEEILSVLKAQEAQIEHLECGLAVTQNNLNYYINGND